MQAEKILLLQVAGVGFNALPGRERWCGLPVKPIAPLFPSVTCSVQATMKTGETPSVHGMIANGFFFMEQWKPLFWEQSSRMVQGPRVWEKARSEGAAVAQLFIQQSLGIDSDIIVSPAPIHKHHGGMIMDCYTRPPELNARLKREAGSVFPLHRYWGPMAGIQSSVWIEKAVISVMRNEKPSFLFAYVPHCDYSFQKYGPGSPRAARALKELEAIVTRIAEQARQAGYRVVVFGDYAITPAKEVIYPNRLLLERGFMSVRDVRGMKYPDFASSKAFAVVDHQIAHVYVFDDNARAWIKDAFASCPSIETVMDDSGKEAAGIAHPRSGDFVLVAKPGCWFDYRWWTDKKQAPDFAGHVDIHNKPGYDPCELFFGWPPPNVSQDPSRIRGTHGRADKGEPVFYASDLELPGSPSSILELARSIRDLLTT